jgi:hypothetical protein
MQTEIKNWINSEIAHSHNEWLVLTFRIDGSILNGFGLQESAWKQPEKVATALSWAINALRRRLKKQNLRFCGYFGGEPAKVVFPHIHGLVEIPHGITSTEIIEILLRYWRQMVERKFKRSLITAIYQDSVISSRNYLHYIARYEGQTFGSGDSKLVLNRSFLF